MIRIRPLLVVLGVGLTGVASARADGPVVLYSLEADSSFAQGCFGEPKQVPQCQCPIVLALDFSGTFALSTLPSGDPLFDMFAIDDIHWTASLQKDIEITGSGIYEIGADPSGEPVQSMSLDLFFNGEGPVAFESDLVDGGDGDFPPVISIPISDGFGCPGVRITVAAAPSGPSADVAPPGGDGFVNTRDFFALLADWGLPGPRPTDIDGSGWVDSGDFLVLLAQWTG